MAKLKDSGPPDPAHILKDPQHEVFAQALAKGAKRIDAYVAAGYKRLHPNSIRLSKRVAVAARVKWLLEQAAKATVIDAVWVQSNLAQHAQNLIHVITDPKTGEIKPGPMFNAAAGNRALELLGRQYGLFKERIELGGKVQVANLELLRKLTPEERTYLRDMLQAAAERAPTPANDDEPDEDEEKSSQIG